MLTAAQRFAPAPYRSPLPGVPDAAWDRFVRQMSAHRIGAVSPSGGYGSFDMRPRRLAELGLMVLRASERRGRRQVQVGDFVLPMTESAFLHDPVEQYKVFARSVVDHDGAVERGDVAVPAGASRSGALAVLHVGGFGALASWPDGAMERTRAVFDRVNGIF